MSLSKLKRKQPSEGECTVTELWRGRTPKTRRVNRPGVRRAQGQQAYVVQVIGVEADPTIRAKNAADCVPGNWVSQIQDPKNVYCVQKHEIAFSVSASDTPAVVAQQGNFPPLRVETTVVNLKVELVKNLRVEGVILFEGNSKGRAGDLGDQAATLKTSGTETLVNYGPYRINAKEYVFALPYAYTTQNIAGDCIGEIKILGQDPQKLMMQTISLSTKDVDRLLKSIQQEARKKLDDLLLRTPFNPKDLQEIVKAFDYKGYGKIPYLMDWMYIDMLAYGIRQMLLGVVKDETKAKALYDLLIKGLQKYYKAEQLYISNYTLANLKNVLPIQLDKTYDPEEAFNKMPETRHSKKKQNKTYMLHALDTVDILKTTIHNNIEGRLKALYVGRAESTGDVGGTYDLFVKA